MNFENIFHIILNLFALKVYNFRVNIYFVIFFQCCINFFTVFIIFFKYNPFKSKIIFFNLINYYQILAPAIVQYFVTFRAVKMRKIQMSVEKDLQLKFLYNECEKNFVIRFFVVVSIRLLKILTAFGNYQYAEFHMQVMFPEIIYASNELLFVYYVELLTDYLEYINYKVKFMRSKKDLKEIRNFISKIFQTKNKIQKRFSIDVLTSLCYTFFLVIIAFYWVLIRIIYNQLKRFEQQSTFFHFFEPIFVYWTLFSRCEKFHKMVRYFDHF
jgi:hypothetical protein